MDDWKNKLSSLLPDDYQPEIEQQHDEKQNTSNNKQTLRVELDKRKGKPATIISGFEGSEEELKVLAKTLKNHCAAGGSQRGGEILIQGDFRQKVNDKLITMGFKTKRINF